MKIVYNLKAPFNKGLKLTKNKKVLGVKKDLTEKVITEQKPQGGEGVCHEKLQEEEFSRYRAQHVQRPWGESMSGVYKDHLFVRDSIEK